MNDRMKGARPTWVRRVCLWGVLAAAVALCACTDDTPGAQLEEDASGTGLREGGAELRDGGIARRDAGIGDAELVFFNSPDTPAFVGAFHPDGQGVVFLAAKDEFGNAVQVLGAVFFYGDTYLRIEVDARGRRRVIATPEETLLLNYPTATELRVDRFHRDDSPSTFTVPLSRADLDALTTPAPSPLFALKATQASYWDDVADYGGVLLCPNRLADGLQRDIARGTRSSLISAGVGCASNVIPLGDYRQLESLLDVIGSAATIGECLVSLAEIGSGAFTVLGVWGAALSCPAAIEASASLGERLGEAILAIGDYLDPPFDSSRLDTGDFFLLVDGSPTERTEEEVTVRMTVRGERDFESATADLSELGGPASAALGLVDGEWQWTGSIRPRRAGPFVLWLSIDGGDSSPAGGGYIRAPVPLVATLTASKSIVERGEEVELEASFSGGVPPYFFAWNFDDEQSPLQTTPEPFASTTANPPSRTRYEIFVGDDSTPPLVARSGYVWVAVCGDDECSPEEAVTSCPRDCPVESTRDGGAEPGDGESDAGSFQSEAGAVDGDAGTEDSGAEAGSATSPTPTPAASPEPPEPPGPILTSARISGDPHLRTFDGLAYDVQPVGELVLVESLDDELQVQIRTAPWDWHKDVSVQVAVAARLGDDRVAAYGDGTLTLNGELIELADGGYDLPGGGQLFVSGGQRTLVWPDGSQLTARRRSYFFDLALAFTSARAGRVRGLLGNFDAQRAGELETRDGSAIARPVPFDVLYGEYAQSFRISQDESLFDYPDGLGTEDFTNLLFPYRFTSFATLDPTTAEAARSRCAAAGISDSVWLEACALDLAVTGDETFIESFLDAPDILESLPIEPPSDGDGDRIRDLADNCPDTPNASQGDVDRDGVGDACDADIDADRVLNEDDDCPTVSDPEQTDSNDDGIGDACEDLPEPEVPEGAGLRLTISVLPEGRVVAGGVDTCTSHQGTCAFALDPGTEVTLLAEPSVGWEFDEWSGDCSGSETTFVLPISGAARCTASFVQGGVPIEPAGLAQTIWQEGFEAGLGAWVVEGGSFEAGVPNFVAGPSAIEGQALVGTGLTGNYEDGQDARLISPEWVVDDAASNPRLSFAYWHQLSSSDFGVVELSVDGGDWFEISPAFIGSSGGWARQVVLLRPYAGHRVRLAVHFRSVNASGGSADVAPGIYVDDVAFATGEMTPPLDEDFENGFGDWSVEGGVWALGTPVTGNGPTARSGTQLFGTNLVGNYTDSNGTHSTRARLVTPEVYVDPTAPSPRLRFNYWYDLSSADDVRVQISVDAGEWRDLPEAPIIGTAGGWSQRVVLLRDFAGHHVRVGILLSTANYSGGSQDVAAGVYVDDATFETGEMVLPVDEDFENGFGDWSVEGGLWALGAPADGVGPTPLSGTQLFGTNLVGNYIDSNGTSSTRARLVTPEMFIDDASQNPRLKFGFWHQLSSADDVRLQISLNGSAWQDLPDAPIIGTAGAWSQRVVLLRDYAGMRVRIGLLLSATNYSGGSQDVSSGMYVDDVTFQTGEMQPPMDEDFEEGFGDWSVEGGVWGFGAPAIGFGPSPLSGTRLVGTNLAGNYIDSNGATATRARLVSPELVIDDAEANPRLKFKFWHQLSSADDVKLQVSVDGNPWEDLADAPIIAVSGGWSQRVVLLRSYAGHRVRIGLLFSTANYSGGSQDVSSGFYVDDADFETGEMSLPVFEDFEGGFGDWSVEGGVWALGTPAVDVGPAPVSGASVFGTNLLGNYVDSNGTTATRARLVTPEFDSNIVNSLTFSVWHDLRAGDSARFQVSSDGASWVDLDETAITGTSDAWYAFPIDLTAFTGARMRVGILLSTSNANGGSQDVGAGFYVDDVTF